MLDLTTALFQIAQIREVEQRAQDLLDISSETLMTRAGERALSVLKRYWPRANHILVICGKGNNGGDGYVLAKLAHEQGFKVWIVSQNSKDSKAALKDLKEEGLTGPALAAAQACFDKGVAFKTWNKSLLQDVDLIVDALLGIGVQGNVRREYEGIIRAINKVSIPVLAIDIPSGIDADTGRVLGVAVEADITVTFIGRKTGLYTGQGPAYCGHVICEYLGLSEKAFGDIKPFARILTVDLFRSWLPSRKRTAYKGRFGHVLVIGGDYGMGGAVHMTGEAAARVGAGLVSIATRPEHISAINAALPELMCHTVQKPQDLDPLLQKATVIAIGPGFGQQEWAKEIFAKILAAPQPKVLDADALNILSSEEIRQENWILTPHSGEAARLLHTQVTDIENDRFAAVKNLQDQYGGVCILKGAGTLITNAAQEIYLCDAGNPGMATGGMGDVLTGVIAGLLAQGMGLNQAACMGVMMHAVAADLVAKEYGERGMLARDLMPYLRRLVNFRFA
jgi:NAD(P)H-hydrate epimerase